MRSATAAELATLAANARQLTFRVKLANGSGTMVDLSSWVERITWDEDVDQPVAGATIEFRRDSLTQQSLSPFRTDSTLNRLDDGVTYAPLLQLNRPVTIEVATTAVGASVQNGDMKLLFQGAVSDFDVAHSPVTATCRDLGGKLVDRWVETEQNFGSGPGVALETVIQQELDAVLGGGGVSLYTPTSPSYLISPVFQQQKMKLADAILALQQLPGWDTRYRWDDGTSSFRFTLRDPNRGKVIPDYTFSPSGYFDITRLEEDLAGIRNAIKLSYPTAGGNRASLTVTDSASITEFDRQFEFVQEGDSSPINTSGEATTMLNAMLADLKDPKAEKEIELPFFWPVQLGDLFRFQANGVHYNEDQDLAVVAYRHELSRKKHRTYLTVRGSPCGGYLTWLTRARAFSASALPAVRPPVALIVPRNIETDSAFWSLRFDARAGSGGGGTVISWEIWSKKDFATESLVASGDGSTLPHDENITRDPRSTQAIRFVVTDTATGLLSTAPFTVPSSRPEVNNGGHPVRSQSFDDGKFAPKASDAAGSIVDASVTESGGKAVNRLLGKVLPADPDSLDGTPEGTTFKRVIGTAVDVSTSKIDFTKTGFLGKNGDNVGRSAGDATAVSTIVGNITNGGHAGSAMQESGGKGINRLLGKALAADPDSLDGAPDGTTYKRIVSVVSGQITPSSSSSRNRCKVSNSANQSIGDSTITKVNFNTEVYDDGGLHDNSVNNERITVPTGGDIGEWRLVASIEFAANATGRREIYLTKNGITLESKRVAAFSAGGFGPRDQIVAVDDTPAVGDFYDVRVFQNSGGALNVLSGSTFAGKHEW